MKQKSTADFISEVKSNGHEKCYFVVVTSYEHDSDYGNEEIQSGIFFNREDAKTAFNNCGATPEFGENLLVSLASCDVDSEDVCYIEDYENEDESYLNTVLKEIVEPKSNYDYLIDYAVDYDYKSVLGAVLVFWSWQTYVGYARKCIEIRDGEFGETEEITLPVDHTYRTQCSILISADEAKNLSVEDRRRLIEQRLLEEKSWKWQNNVQNLIDRYMEDYED